ncbi:MAG TPA: enoyl-CoA hydratase/isomerase family protein [Thermoleophilaceae bacterium]
MPGTVSIEQRGEVALVRMDRPPANAMNPELMDDGRAALEELRAAEPAAVVLTGRPGFFSAGVDLKLAPTLDAAAQREMVDAINHAFLDWYSFPRPVVSAVNGHAVAGGLILALTGDRRVGAGDGKLGLTELRAGIPYPVAAMAIVKAELTAAAARTLALGAELVDMRTGVELGLIDELVEPDHLIDRALELAGGLAALPRSAYARVKEQVRGETIASLRARLESGADPMLGGWLGEETASASAAILDRG